MNGVLPSGTSQPSGDGMRAMPMSFRLARTILRRLPAGRYRLAQLLAGRSSGVFLARLPQELGGYTFECDLRDVIARDVCFTGYYEPQETALLRALLPAGGTCVDVGANWGYFTLLAAHQTGPSGRVLALEPDPVCFAALRRNIDRNDLRHVVAVPYAAVQGPGLVPFVGGDIESGNSGLARVVGSDEPGATLRVPGCALDALLDGHGLSEVDVMKIDVEGSEVHALRGLADTIATQRVRAILIELHPAALARAAVSVATLFSPLEAAGYVGYTIDHHRDATRRAAYARSLNPSSLLRPLNGHTLAGDWPHVLWIRKGGELP
jgi:FkbM family methyltransferase